MVDTQARVHRRKPKPWQRQTEWRPFPSEEGRTEKHLFHMLAHAEHPGEADEAASCQR